MEVGAQPSVLRAAFHHAGFAIGFLQRGKLSEPNRHPAREVFERLLKNLNPCPAFVFDANWYIRDANCAARWLMAVLMPDYLAELHPDENIDMIASCTHPKGLLSSMQNAEPVGHALLQQLQLESSANPLLGARIERFARSLCERYGKAETSHVAAFGHLTFNFHTTIGPVDFFRFQSLVDLPQDVTLHSLRAEIWLPLNNATRSAMLEAGSYPVVTGDHP